MQPQLVNGAHPSPEGSLTLIKGETKSGKKFRPSDWADRLFGAVACFARDEFGTNHEISDCVCVVNRNGVKGVIIDHRLCDLEPNLYNFLQAFADDNNLVTEALDINDWNRDRRRVITKPQRSFA